MSRRKPKHDYPAVARMLVSASPELASVIAVAAQQEPGELKAWAESIIADAGEEDCTCEPDVEAMCQALIEAAS